MDGSPAPAAAVNRTTVAAIIPAYFEEKHIGDVVERTLKQLDNVLVIDDGSTDATAANARAAGAQLIVHERNLGKGEAIKAGLHYWVDRGFRHIVMLDAVGSIYPKRSRGLSPRQHRARSSTLARG